LFTNILVDLDLELPCRSFAEGARVDATVRATAAREVTASGGSLELVRTITYRYTAWSPYASPFTATARAAEVVSRASFQLDGPLAAGRPRVWPLSLAVPANGPGSAHTELVEIDWAVHARLRIDQGRDVEATTPIRVLSRARDCAAVAHLPPEVEDQGAAVLGFESLSSRRLVADQPLSGVLTVQPLRPFSARSVRVDLVLAERVLHGPWLTDDPARNPDQQEKYAETVVASVPLAIHAGFDPGQLLRYEFSVPAPARLQAPTMHTPAFSLTWMLRGMVDRQLRRDPCVAVELHAVTTPD
jgi:hypothetical protein